MPLSPALARLPQPGAYVKTWRRIIDAVEGKIAGYDPSRYDVSIERAFWPTGTARDVGRQFRRALHSRINSRGGVGGKRGRRDDQDYETNLRRDARTVLDYRTRRVCNRGSGLLTKEARERFPDIQAAMTDRSDY